MRLIKLNKYSLLLMRSWVNNLFTIPTIVEQERKIITFHLTNPPNLVLQLVLFRRVRYSINFFHSSIISIATQFQSLGIKNGYLRIIGSIDSNKTFDPAITMLKNNKDFKKIITHIFSITEYIQAFKTLGLDLKTGKRGEIFGNKLVIVPE